MTNKYLFNSKSGNIFVSIYADDIHSAMYELRILVGATQESDFDLVELVPNMKPE
jgi:hypothetical protein